jgi:glycerophosphoryl diester phosphodiesterase
MFRIFAHRGFWKTKDEENSLYAFQRALEGGFDIEADLRFMDGKFVIKHDQPNACEILPSLKDVLSILKKYPDRELALHFKYDDWQNPLSFSVIDIIKPFNKQVFLFDMSIEYCEEIKNRDESIRVGVSVGDRHYHDAFASIEDTLVSNIDIVWADEFRQFYSSILFEMCKKKDKIIYCISPDLAAEVGHPNSKNGFVEALHKIIKWGANGICTDKPMEVRKIHADNSTRSR